jgi:hypothetical protein
MPRTAPASCRTSYVIDSPNCEDDDFLTLWSSQPVLTLSIRERPC